MLFIGDVWGNGIQHKLSTNEYKNLKRASSPRPLIWSTYRAPVAVRLPVPGEPGLYPKAPSELRAPYRVNLAVDSGTLEGGANPRNGEAEPILLTT